MTLTWANSNDWAESSTDLRSLTGLTPFGIQVIHQMNRLGIIIDVSHSSDQTLADVLIHTRAPILATHSAARTLTDSPRNLTDDQLRAIAQNNGAIMVNFYSAFIDESYRKAHNQLKPERAEAHRVLEVEYAARNQPIPFSASNAIDRAFAARIPRPPLGSLIDHIDHIIRTAGLDHVGIGTDFDGISSLPEGIDSAADLPKITAALHARGYTTSDLHKLLGGNLLRVFRDVQSVAQKST
jgi:membrane dipeptidase